MIAEVNVFCIKFQKRFRNVERVAKTFKLLVLNVVSMIYQKSMKNREPLMISPYRARQGPHFFDQLPC